MGPVRGRLPAEEIARGRLPAAGLCREILGRVGELGVVAPGALADLLVVDGNPLRDISLLAEPEKSLRRVMKSGELFTNQLDSRSRA